MDGPFEMRTLMLVFGGPIRNRAALSLSVRRGLNTEATRHDRYR
jgi:hypothetical protein